MSNDHKINNPDEIHEILSKLHMESKRWLLWQNINEERITSSAEINSIDYDDNLLSFNSLKSEFNYFNKDSVLYCYQADESILFKMIISDLSESSISTTVPSQLLRTVEVEKKYQEDEDGIKISGMTQFLDDGGTRVEGSVQAEDNFSRTFKRDDTNLSDVQKVKTIKQEVTNFDISLSEYQLEPSDLGIEEPQEDIDVEIDNPEAYKHLRTSERLKPKLDQKIKIQRVTEEGKGEPEEFLLADLSQGGAGFYVVDIDVFKKGEIIQVLASGGKIINPPLVGEIVAIRKEGPEAAEFKIGVKFQ